MTTEEYKRKHPEIKTSFIQPSIPIRIFDWVAWCESLGGVIICGSGKTEWEAIDDLYESQKLVR